MIRRNFLKLLALPSLTLPSISIASSILNTKEYTDRFIRDPIYYLEISGRRSGKTTRLIQDMKHYIDTYNKPVFFAYCFDIDMYIKHYSLESYMPMIVPFYIDNYIKNPLRTYFDEFECLPANKQYIINNGYYCGTPVTGEFSKRLVEANNGKYINNKTYYDCQELRDEWLSHMGEKVFKREYLGEWK